MKKVFITICFVVLLFSAPVYSELIDNHDGTITDTDTGLMWLQDANVSGSLTWSEAKSWAHNLTHAGYDDWRLPNDFNDCIGFDCRDSEMGHLYYSENVTTASHSLFINIKDSVDYWTGSYPIVKTFNFSNGRDSEGHDIPHTYNYAMAVRDVAVVPESISSKLFFIGAGVLIGGTIILIMVLTIMDRL
jgi:hypothetical protein